MRLGELLVSRRLVTEDQLRAALEAQQSQGGRLGTNLVQLGYVDVDALGRALGEQRGVPAAQQKHLASVDKRVLSLFSARTVASYKAIPLGYTATKPARVIVACVDPEAVPVEELAFAAGSRVDVWVAPELLVQEGLERYFGVAPPQRRYVDVSFGAPKPRVASAPPLARPEPAVARPALGRLSPPPPPLSPRPASLLSPPPPPPDFAPLSAPRPLPLPPRSAPVLEPPPPPSLNARRSVLPAPPDPELPPEDGWDTPDDEPEASSSGPPPLLHPIIDQLEASRMIEMATSKEHIGRVLADWLRSTFGSGLVLIVKNDMAVGWHGFFPDAEDLIEAVAVPLGKPSLFSRAYETRAVFCGPPPEEGAKVNQLFWKLLRCTPPYEVLVCPVVLGNRTVNLLYAHPDDEESLTDTTVRQAQVLAGDAAAGYLRLIRRERGPKRRPS